MFTEVPSNTPVALMYTRVSTEEGTLSPGLEVQVANCRAYAAAADWILGLVYHDAMSGNRDDRPGYQALLAEARLRSEAGLPTVVVVAALDRLGRRLLERVRCREELKALGVAVHSVREGGEVSDLVATVLAAVAQEETRRLAERISAVKRHLIEQGWHPFGSAPWGYRWRPATPEERALGSPKAVLDLDPGAAPYVRELYAMVVRGGSTAWVKRWVASLPEDARGNHVLTRSNAADRLRYAVYIARPQRGDPDVLSRPVARWPALVSDELWRQTQAILANSRRRCASGRYLLSGFLRCPRCGTPAAGYSGSIGSLYKCNGDTATQATRCRAQIGPMAPLDGATLDGVRRLLRPLTAPDAQGGPTQQRWQRWRVRKAALHVAELHGWEEAADQAQRRLAVAGALFLDQGLDVTGYEAVREHAQADLRAAQEARAEARRRSAAEALPTWDQLMQHVRRWMAALDGASVFDQRGMLNELLERVERIGRPRRKFYRVQFTWTPLGTAIERLRPGGHPLERLRFRVLPRANVPAASGVGVLP